MILCNWLDQFLNINILRMVKPFPKYLTLYKSNSIIESIILVRQPNVLGNFFRKKSIIPLFYLSIYPTCFPMFLITSLFSNLFVLSYLFLLYIVCLVPISKTFLKSIEYIKNSIKSNAIAIPKIRNLFEG